MDMRDIRTDPDPQETREWLDALESVLDEPTGQLLHSNLLTGCDSPPPSIQLSTIGHRLN